ncbi:MAG: hypothetical protein E3J72_19430 [Planctomycetota bacterium]|nr:MAG: hypothetical protein E3J72_19430 [Planctomycetota bacterium]
MEKSDGKQDGLSVEPKVSRRSFLAVKQKDPDAEMGISPQAWEFDALLRKLKSFEAGLARLEVELQRISEKLEKLASKKIKFRCQDKKDGKVGEKAGGKIA